MDQFLSALGQALGIVNRLPSPLNIIVWILLGVGVTGFLLWKIVKIVHQTDEAMVFRRGTVRTYRKTLKDKVVGGIVYKREKGAVIYRRPGRLHYLVPGIDKMITVSMRLRTFELQNVQVQHSFFRRENVSATAVFSVINPYMVWFVADDLQELVTSACESQLGIVLAKYADGDVRASQRHIVAEFAHAVEREIAEYGLRLKNLYITDVVSESQHVIAESQASIADAIRGK